MILLQLCRVAAVVLGALSSTLVLSCHTVARHLAFATAPDPTEVIHIYIYTHRTLFTGIVRYNRNIEWLLWAGGSSQPSLPSGERAACDVGRGAVAPRQEALRRRGSKSLDTY